MFKKIVAAQPLSDTELIVWFEGGETRLLDVRNLEELQVEDNLMDAKLVAEGYGISWGDDSDVSSKDVYEKSCDIDLVEDECARVIGDVVEARHEAGISQAKLAAAAGVKQPVIARLETRVNSPRLDTLLRVLAPLGKTVCIVDANTKETEPGE